MFIVNFADAHSVVAGMLALVALLAASAGAVCSYFEKSVEPDTRLMRRRRVPRVRFAASVVALVTLLSVIFVVAHTVDDRRSDRVVAAIEAKYEVHVDHVGTVNATLQLATIWAFDGIARSCQVQVTDWQHPNPVVVCGGTELTKPTTR